MEDWKELGLAWMGKEEDCSYKKWWTRKSLSIKGATAIANPER